MALNIYSFDPDERIARVAYSLYCKGFSDSQIADSLHVAPSTWARKKGKVYAMFEVFDKEGSATYIEKKDRKLGNPRTGVIKITEEKKKQVLTLSEFGLTIGQICKFLKVSEGTLYKVFRDDPGFYSDVRDARVVADIQVFQAMRKKAVGFTAKSVSETEFQAPNGTVLTRTKTKSARQVEPSDKMIQFMMINRHKWSNNAEREPENHDKHRTEYDVRRKLYNKTPSTERQENEEQHETTQNKKITRRKRENDGYDE